MLKLKISGENRKFRIFSFLFMGIVCLIWAAMSGFGVNMFAYGVFYAFFIVPLLFLGMSIFCFWVAWQIIKLPPNS